MRAPLSWLRDYAPLEATPKQLASTLSSLGLVVEGIQSIGADLPGVVVARVAAIKTHPDAERIRLVDVDAGGGKTFQVVCGAWNFSEGDLVPMAVVGTTLPSGVEIRRRRIRGQHSEGMLCSAPELGIPDPNGAGAGGLLILPAGLADPGTPLAEALHLESDVVFDLDVSPNRPDALCMAGVARDLAAALGEPWSRPVDPEPPAPDPGVPTPPVHLDAGDLCPRLTATVFEGVALGPSPPWMSRRLQLAGMRPINAVVDVSNYVMLDVGQPNHAYDLDRLGGGGIGARRARSGEMLQTLDGVLRTLREDDCLICDAQGRPVGLGGIMGGADSEIDSSTRRVLLEVAWFTPMAIARTGERLGLQTDARTRFERGVDPEIAKVAVERFAALLALACGPGLRRGSTAEATDPAHLPQPRSVRVRTQRVNSILGTSLDEADIARLVTPIGFVLEKDGPGSQRTRVPSWRLDVEREIDVIEEVARTFGYGAIEPSLPRPPMAGAYSGRKPGLTPRQRERRRLREAMAGAGFDEAWTTSFLAPGDLEKAGLDAVAVEVANPLDRSESLLRTSLLPGLLKAVRSNADRQAPSVRLFEIGRVFYPPADGSVLPREAEHLGVIAAPLGTAEHELGAAHRALLAWAVAQQVLRLEAVELDPAEVPGLHPGRAALLTGSDGTLLGHVGEVDPTVVELYKIEGRAGWLCLSLEALENEPRRSPLAREVSRFPAADMDLAFVVDEEVTAASVARTLRAAGGELLEQVRLFDVYRGARLGSGRRSLAFRLRWRAPDRTLDEAELAVLRQRAIEAVADAHRAELRS